MSQPWFSVSSGGSGGHTRRAPSTYLPPHVRTQPVAANPPHSCPRRRVPLSAAANPFDLSQKFDELEIISQEENDGDQVAPMGEKPTSHDDVPVEAEGRDIPPPVTSFEEMGFSAKALSENIRRCKYVNPTPIQRHAIPVAMTGRDLMACAQTGSGKTAAFCFPIINGVMVGKQNQHRNMMGFGNGGLASPMALILAPTRELACQIHDEAKKFSYQTGVKVDVVYGGTPIYQQLRSLGKGVDMLVATPGRLVDLIDRSKVSLTNVKYLALDEADRMLDMGFERQVRKIVQQLDMPPPSARQTMLFSATFPPEIKRLASDFLSNYIFLAAGKVGSSTDLIVQRVEFVPEMDKRSHLMNLLSSQRKNKTSAKDALTLVFVETKRGADSLEMWLSRKGYHSAAIHGDKVQVERERALNSFRNGRTAILVATDVAARGLDIPHVAHVINFDLPRSVDDYVHRIGRTGRAGKSGLATAFFNEKNASLAKPLIELMHEANQVVPTWLTEYANTPSYTGGGGRRPRNYNINGYSKQYGADMAPDPYANSNGYSNQYGADMAPDPYANSNGHSNQYGADMAPDPYANIGGSTNGALDPYSLSYPAYVAESCAAPCSCNYDGSNYGPMNPSGWD